MLFKELREKKQMMQRQFAGVVEINAPTYSEIERGESCTKWEQITNLLLLNKIWRGKRNLQGNMKNNCNFAK
jgi:predicted XRE-type DNA-binding protein